MARFFLYECRHGDEKILVPASKTAWDYLLEKMEYCNGATLEEIIEDGESEVSGSFEEGHLSVDDGGTIEEIELTDVS